MVRLPYFAGLQTLDQGWPTGGTSSPLHRHGGHYLLIPTLFADKTERSLQVVTNQPHCHSCHSIDIKLMEKIGQANLVLGLDFFFF